MRPRDARGRWPKGSSPNPDGLPKRSGPEGERNRQFPEHPPGSHGPRIERIARALVHRGATLAALILLAAPSADATEIIEGDMVITTNTSWSTDHQVNGSLTISNGATLTLEGNFAHRVTGNLSLVAGASIDANAQGHPPDSGPVAGETSLLNGGGGAGHGGHGGAGSGGPGSSAGGFNDSGLLPALLGSGGGSGLQTAGGAGGGVIRFAVAGTCQLDGTLSANGASAFNHNDGGAGGGGAGGTIRLFCNTLGGSGLLRANGGNGGRDPTATGGEAGQGGGAGGGRIAVRAIDTSGFTNKGGALAEPGLGAGGVGPDSESGGRGTVVFITVDSGADPLADDGKGLDLDLELYRSWRWEPSVDGSFSYRSVSVEPDCEIVAGDGDVSVAATSFSIDSATWDTTVASTNGPAASGSVSLDVSTLSFIDSQLIADSASADDWNLAVSSSASMSGGQLLAQNVSFSGTGDLAFTNAAQVSARELSLIGSSLTQDATTSFSTSGGGHPADSGPTAGGTSPLNGGGGGGHGGHGGAGAGGPGTSGGVFNDSGLLPALPGSGGGSGLMTAGGAGGGVIRAAVSGSCQLDGSLSANGASALNDHDGGTGGGGAGGTVRLFCSTLSGSGSITANGGGGGEDQTLTGGEAGQGGGGGGGRVVVRATDFSGFTSKDDARADAGNGGDRVGPAGSPGGAGTVAFITVDAGANPLEDDDKSHDRDLELYRGWRWEPSVDGSFSYQSIAVRPGCQVVSGDGDVTLTAASLSLDSATWNTTIASSNGVAGSGNVDLNLGTLSLVDSNLAGDPDSGDWSAVVSSSSMSGGTLEGRNLSFAGTGDLVFSNGAELTAQRIALLGHSFDQDATSLFSADARGHPPDSGPGLGEVSPLNGGGGGGHGGNGGQGGGGPGSAGGVSYGSRFFPSELGSGGGSGEQTPGGIGGGMITIGIAGPCTVDGTLRADGAHALMDFDGGTGGGGAGGSIRLFCDSLAGGAAIHARGGNGGADPTGVGTEDGQGGGGAGGRISVHFSSSDFGNAAGISVAGGITGTGVGEPGTNGEAGTLFFGTLPATRLVVTGTAVGGQILLEIFGIAVQVTTTAGQSAEQVAAAIAAAVLATPELTGIQATPIVTDVVVTAPFSLPTSGDPGIQISFPLPIPALAPSTTTLLALAMLILSYTSLRRRGCGVNRRSLR